MVRLVERQCLKMEIRVRILVHAKIVFSLTNIYDLQTTIFLSTVTSKLHLTSKRRPIFTKILGINGSWKVREFFIPVNHGYARSPNFISILPSRCFAVQFFII